MLIGFFKWWCERTMWVEIFIRRANTMFPIYLLTFTGIIAFYVIDFFFRYPSLSLSFSCFHHTTLTTFCMCSCMHSSSTLAPLPKSNDIQLSKELWFLTSVVMFQTHLLVVVFVRNRLYFPCYSRRHLPHLLHSHHVHFIYTCASSSIYWQHNAFSFAPHSMLGHPNIVVILAQRQHRITANNTIWHDMKATNQHRPTRSAIWFLDFFLSICNTSFSVSNNV